MDKGRQQSVSLPGGKEPVSIADSCENGRPPRPGADFICPQPLNPVIANLLRLTSALAVGLLILLTWALIALLDWPLAVALPAGILLVLMGHAGFLGIEFAATAWLGRHAVAPADAPLLDQGSRLKAWLTEIPVALKAFFWSMPWFGARPLASGNTPGRMPVVLVHGFFCNQAMFSALARDLAAAGHPVAGVNLEPPTVSIDAFSAQIDDVVSSLTASTGSARVALVAHSMGGLAVRAWLRNHGDDRMHSVVTLGTPHQGTVLAKFGFTATARQMQPDSEWLRQLASAEPAGRMRRFTVVVSMHDNIIVPPCPQSVPGANQIVMRGLGHVDLAVHPCARALVVKLLDSAACATPAKSGASDPRAPSPRPDPRALRG